MTLAPSTAAPTTESMPHSRLRRALLVSVLVHAMALSGLRGLVADPQVLRPVGRLHAELRQVGVVSAAPVSARAVESTPGTRKAPRDVLSEQASKAAPPVVAGGSASATLEHSETPRAPAPAGQGAGDPLPRPAETPKPAIEPSPAYDSEDLRQYKLAVAVQARRYKRYPALARERGWEGTTEIAVSVLPEARTPSVAVEKSSGFPVLDEQAVEMIRRASGAAPIPPGMQQRGVRFVLPVQFSLDE